MLLLLLVLLLLNTTNTTGCAAAEYPTHDFGYMFSCLCCGLHLFVRFGITNVSLIHTFLYIHVHIYIYTDDICRKPSTHDIYSIDSICSIIYIYTSI